MGGSEEMPLSLGIYEVARVNKFIHYNHLK